MFKEDNVEQEQVQEGYLGDFDFGNIGNVETESLVPDIPAEDTSGKAQEPEGSVKNELEIDVNQIFQEKEETEDVEKIKQADEQEEDTSLEAGKIKEDGDKKNSDTDSPVKDISSNTSVAVAFAEALLEQGNLSEDFDLEAYKKDVEEKGGYEAFSQLFQNEAEKNKKEIESQYDADYKSFLELKQSGIQPDRAVDLLSTKEYYDKIDVEQLINDDNAELRKEVIGSYFAATTKFSEDEIEDMVTQIFDSGKDIEYAKKALPQIKTHIKDSIQTEKDAQQQIIDDRKAKSEEFQQNLRSTIDGLTEVIPGEKINKQTKDKLYKTLTDPIKTKQGQYVNAVTAKRLENPEKFDVTLAYLINSGAFDNKGWGKIEKKIETSASKKARELLDKKTTSSLSTPRAGDGGEKDMLKAMKLK